MRELIKRAGFYNYRYYPALVSDWYVVRLETFNSKAIWSYEMSNEELVNG